jgi:hypothetical protein
MLFNQALVGFIQLIYHQLLKRRNHRQLSLIKYLFLFMLSGFIVFVYANILQHRIINPDAGYYLWIVNKISEGKIPGIDIRSVYMPLSFYILSTVKLFIGSPTYFHYLYILLFIQLINALLLYYIAKHYTKDNFILVLVFLLYLLMSFHSDGSFFVLEPFVNLFGLASLLLYLRIRNLRSYFMLLPGILAACAFFCKQYGLVYIFVVPILSVIDSKDISTSLKEILFYTSGYFIPFILFIVYLKIESGGLDELITSYSGGGYGQRSIVAYLSGLYTLIKIYGIFLPFSLWILIKKGIRNHIIVYLYLIAGFSLQFFFYKFPHYYLLLIPYVILAGVIINDSLKERFTLSLSCLLLVLYTIIINTYSNILTLRNFSGSYSIIKESYVEQEKNSVQINKYVGVYDKVLLFDFNQAPYYFLSNINPPLEKKYGIIFSGNVSHDSYLENLNHTNFVLIPDESLKEFYRSMKLIGDKWIEIKISDHLLLLKKVI